MSVKTIAAKVLARIFCLFPIDKNKVVFSSFHGKYYNDAPRNIAECLRDDIKQVWVLPENAEVPANIQKVKPFSISELFQLETSKVWVDNSRKYLWVRKRKGQYYIQTWHAGAAIKKIEAEVESSLPVSYVERAKHDSQMADLFVSDCEFLTKQYKSIFWYDGEIMKSFIRTRKRSRDELISINKRVRETYGLNENDKLIIYAPTFRASGDLGPYEIDCKKVIKAFTDKFGGVWKFVLRLHPNISQYQTSFVYDEEVLNGSIYPDLDDMICTAEAVITDYSSCVFFGMYMSKITFIFAKDWKDYERGFSVDIRQLPSPFSESNEELIKNITEFDVCEYEKRRDDYIKEIGYYDDVGPEIVARRIEDVIDGNFKM